MEVRASGSGSGHDCPLNWVFCPRGTGDVAPKCPLGCWPRWEDEIRIWPPAKLGAHRGQLGVAFARGAVELPAGRGVGGGSVPIGHGLRTLQGPEEPALQLGRAGKTWPLPLAPRVPQPLAPHVPPLQCIPPPPFAPGAPHPLNKVPLTPYSTSVPRSPCPCTGMLPAATPFFTALFTFDVPLAIKYLD